jgi:hypothetical protein
MNGVLMHSYEAAKLRTLNRMVGEGAQRDLGLLTTIEKTIDALQERKAEAHIHIDIISRAIAGARDYPEVIDEDGSIVEMWEKTRDVISKVHSIFSEMCDSAKCAPELHHDDGVVEAYCEFLDALAVLHNSINELCWTIGEHDADFAEVSPGGPYQSADDLIAALEA